MSGAAASSFDWFTGLAKVAAPCPPAMPGPHGVARFFTAPNDAAWGAEVPRILMHESIHAFQLAGCRWLQRMVAEEWERLLQMERTGTPGPPGPLRSAYGRVPAGQGFSVRDIVEGTARFWDIHIRSPRRILAEARGEPPAQGTAADWSYSGGDYNAAMLAGQRASDGYARPYLVLRTAALESPAIRALGAASPERNPWRASWAAQMLLPIASFVALNTDDPVRAFVVALDAVLALPEAAERLRIGNPWDAIELDWVLHWGWLVPAMAGALKQAGLPVLASPNGLADAGWSTHPVWRLHAGRCAAFRAGLAAMVVDDTPPAAVRPWSLALSGALHDLLRRHAFAAWALVGLPDLRLQLGVAFAPPLLRFVDADVPAGSGAAPGAPWPVDDSELAGLVQSCAKRHRVLRDADVRAKLSR